MALPRLNHQTLTTTLPESHTVVKYRPFLRGEEKILLIAKESESESEIESAIYQVIEQCTSGQITGRLSSIDLEFLFLKLRIASKGQTTRIGLKCKAHVERPELDHPTAGKIEAYSGPCDTINEVTIDLANVVAHVPDVSERTIEITDEIGIQMRYPDSTLMSAHKKLESEADVMAIVYDCIESIYDSENVYDVDDLEDKKAELDAFFDQFTDKQTEKISKFFDDLPCLRLEVKFKCKSCGHEDSITLRGIQDFF